MTFMQLLILVLCWSEFGPDPETKARESKSGPEIIWLDDVI